MVSAAQVLKIVLVGALLSGCAATNRLNQRFSGGFSGWVSGIGSQSQKGEPLLRINWVSPTYDQALTSHRKMNRMTPVVTDQLVIQGNNLKDLVAFDRKWGRIVWRREFKGGVEAGAVAFKNRLYVAANDGSVEALDLKSGQTIWSFPTSSENVSAPVLDTQTGLLYFQNSQNMVFCLEAESGRQVWIYSRNDATLLTIRGAATPALGANGNLYVGFSDGTFVALKASSGQLLWDQTLNRNKRFRDIDAQAVVSGDLVIVSGYDDKIYGLDQISGNTVWSYPAGSYVAVTLGEAGSLYVGTTSGTFVKLKADNGEAIWTYSDVKGLPTQAIFWNQYVAFGESQGKLKILNSKTGQLVTSFEPGRGVFSRPFLDVENQDLMFVSGEAYLYNLKFVQKSRQSFSFIE